MHRITWIAAIFMLGMSVPAAAIDVLDPTTPLAVQAVQIAIPEAERRGLDVPAYETVVYQDSEGLAVGFQNPGPRPKGCRGNCGPLPELVVKLDADATGVLGSHYVR